MKRQRGRNRNGSPNNGNKPPQQNANRAFESNGPENIKVRGNAQHVFEKYQQLARDATTAGDRVLAENYLQHAEHYFRVVRAMQPTRPASEILGRDQFVSGFDIDFEDESGAQAAALADADAAANGEAAESSEGETETRDRNSWRDERPRDERPRDERQRDERPRDERPREDRGDRPRYRDRDDRWRDDRPRGEDRPPREDRGERPRDERPRDERARDERPRDERPRDDRPRGERPEGGRRDRWREREDRPREDRPERDPMAVIEPQNTPMVSAPILPVEEKPHRFCGTTTAAKATPPPFSRPCGPVPPRPSQPRKPATTPQNPPAAAARRGALRAGKRGKSTVRFQCLAGGRNAANL